MRRCAHRLDLPNLELRACETAASRGVMLTGLFPVPHYSADERLSASILRWCSRSRARKAVSARRRLQCRRARPDADDARYGAASWTASMPSEKQLEDPSYNLDLGQRYLRQLLGQMNGNLVELAAAYNAGPGAVTRWMGARGTMMHDPLLFIESIPRRADARLRQARAHLLLDVCAPHRRTARRRSTRRPPANGPNIAAMLHSATPPPPRRMWSSAMPQHPIDETRRLRSRPHRGSDRSDTRDASNDTSGDTLAARIEEAGSCPRRRARS